MAQEKCNVCNGTGRNMDGKGGWKPCIRCGGSGTVYAPDTKKADTKR